jgi:RNA polymerase sigma factor (sigma-70 family)
MSQIDESAAPFDSNEHYQKLRLKLVLYFERRNCGCPEDLADDCLNRVFLHVRKHGPPTSLERFTFGFASKVFFEWLRDSSRFTPANEDSFVPDPGISGPSAQRSRSLAETSIGQLDPAERELMEQYYLDGRTADSLATEWGLSPEGVRSRVFRNRRRLLRYFLEQKGSGRETNWVPPNMND